MERSYVGDPTGEDGRDMFHERKGIPNWPRRAKKNNTISGTAGKKNRSCQEDYSHGVHETAK